MNQYSLRVIYGASFYDVIIEAENCEPVKEGYYHFWDKGSDKKFDNKSTVCTYPINATIIMKISPLKDKSMTGNDAAIENNGKINHNEKRL